MACYCVLQVEDDENDIYFLNHACKHSCLTDRLRVVRSGEEALEYLQGVGKYADRVEYPIPGIVFLDLRMPRMSGLDVLKWIRSQPPLHCLVVIMLTSSAHPDDIERASKLGANAFVQKPLGLKEFVRFLECVKSFWCEFHQFPPALNRILLDVPKPALNP